MPARPDASQPSAHTKRFQPARAPGPQREGALTLPSPRRTQRGRGRRRHIAGQARVKQRGRHSSSASAVPGAWRRKPRPARPGSCAIGGILQPNRRTLRNAAVRPRTVLSPGPSGHEAVLRTGWHSEAGPVSGWVLRISFRKKPAMVACACNLGAQEVTAEGLVAQGQSVNY